MAPKNRHGGVLLEMLRGEDMLRYADEHVASFNEFAFQVLFCQLHKRLRGQLNDENLSSIFVSKRRIESRRSRKDDEALFEFDAEDVRGFKHRGEMRISVS